MEPPVVGNFGRPVHKACPPSFTLQPMERLNNVPAELDQLDLGKIPKHIQLRSDIEINDLARVKLRLLKHRFDHLNYDPFIETQDGQAIFGGVLSPPPASRGRSVKTPATAQTSVKEPPAVDEEEQPKNLYAFLIKNGLTKLKRRRRNDPVDTMPRMDFSKKKVGSLEPGDQATPKKLTKF